MKNKVHASRYNTQNDIKNIIYIHFPHILNKVKENSLVLLKPNMFTEEKGYYTNPIILRELAELFKEVGAKVVIAERLNAIYEVLKHFPEISKLCEIKSFDDLPITQMKIENATSLRQEIGIPSILLECDFLVGVPQFRTHAGVLMSNALKNMVGILPGFTTRMVHNVGLTEAIVDLNRMRKQDLVVADLTTTIEGNYPIKGTPMHRDTIVIGDNAVAVDLIAADLSGFDSKSIDYLRLSSQAGLGPKSTNEIDILSDYNDLKFDCIKAGISVNQKNKNISINNGNACPECERFCNSLYELLHEGEPLKEEVLIATGCAIIEKYLTCPSNNTILIGNCTYAHRNKGIFVEGCPPRALQALAVSEWIKNKGKVSEKHKNQCRWPEHRGEFIL